MSSPAQQRLAALLKKKEGVGETYKPLHSLPKGYLFSVKNFTHKQSNYPAAGNPNGPKPFILIPHFVYADTNMYTYLPKEFSSADEETIKDTAKVFNEDISKGIAINFAFYGLLDGQAKAKIHFNDEDIDYKLIEDVKRWELNNANSPASQSPFKVGDMQGNASKSPSSPSPYKRAYTQDSLQSPYKKNKLDPSRKLDFE